MKSLLAVSGSMLCALVAACALDSEPEDVADPATSSNSAELAVPPELSLDALGEPSGGGDHGHDKFGCRVELVTCRDANVHPPRAVFEKKGKCKGSEAFKKASDQCEKFCNRGECKRLIVY